MALEDFERQLARDKEDGLRRDSHHPDRKSEHRHHHRHHRSSRHHDDEDGHRSKRRRHSDEDDQDDRRHRRSRHHRRHEHKEDVEVPKATTQDAGGADLKRDSWMEAPAAVDIDYVRRPQKPQSPQPTVDLGTKHELKIHEKELNHHLRDLQNNEVREELETVPANHEVDYSIGDAGSSWRMTRLRAVYRKAEETGRKVEDVALERYDSLREFDDAREEETELDRRKTYGQGYVGKDKPSGELYQERKLDAGVHRSSNDDLDDELDSIVDNVQAPAPTTTTPKLDSTALNKLKAQVLRAKLKKDPNATALEQQYTAALTASTQPDPTTVQLSAMDNRMLSSAPRNEVQPVTNRRAAERGAVEDNESMTIEDMVREEKRTRDNPSSNDARRFAERIAKDGKFTTDHDYLDENASKLAKRVHQTADQIRNTVINSYQKTTQILANCQLCHHEDTSTPPVAPIVSLATRTYLTLPTLPELAKHSAMIVPTTHHTNLLACDDDEWEEIRNFMKSLTRLYHSLGLDVLFYENAARPHRQQHAAMVAVPLPYSLGETAPAFFQEAFLTAEGEWSQHKKIIDTLSKSKSGGMGRSAFRKSIAKEMPYFHVWFELDGGYGHVVEEPERWPRGDLFAREVVGGMLGLEMETVKKQGRWVRGGEEGRVEGFRRKWGKFDWTRALVEGG